MTEPKTPKSFVEQFVKGKTLPEQYDRILTGTDYVELTKLARQVVNEKWEELLMMPWKNPEAIRQNPGETGKFSAKERQVLRRRLMAPFETAIWGISTDQLIAPDSDVLIGDGEPAETFKELKARLHVMMDGVANNVSHNSRHDKGAKPFTARENDALQKIYTEMSHALIDRVDEYKQLTSAEHIIGSGFVSKS